MFITTVHVLNSMSQFFVFDWQVNSWGINFHGHGSMTGTIIVAFAKCASYCG